MSEEKRLPDPGERYHEIEAAKLHGGWEAWLRLRPSERGMLLAHELHRNMREHYYYDVRTAKGEQVEKPKGEMPWDRMRRRYEKAPAKT